MISQSALARLWNISQPAVSKLVARGMPLTSPEDAAAWKALDSQRRGRASTAPAESRPKTAARKKAASTSSKATPPKVTVALARGVGAEHALTRLAEAEFHAHKRAEALGERVSNPEPGDNVMQNAALLKAAEESWLRISESLRKFDLLIAENRRDSGQLVPRAESELACELAAMWLRLAVRTFIGSYVERIIKAGNNPAAVVRLIEDGMEAGVSTSLLRCTDCRVPLQAYAIAAVRRGYGLGGTAPLPAEGVGDAD